MTTGRRYVRHKVHRLIKLEVIALIDGVLWLSRVDMSDSDITDIAVATCFTFGDETIFDLVTDAIRFVASIDGTD